MTGRNFSKMRTRQNIAGRGHEPIDGGSVAIGAPKARTSKADLRNQIQGLASSSTMITKMIECTCGHRGKVRIPLSRADGPFRCVKCQTRTP